MPSIFTRIIRGEIPCEKLAEDGDFFAFLDIRPIAPGHTLVVPKLERDNLFDLDDPLLRGLMPFAKRVAQALSRAVPCRRVGLMVAGFEVPHAHLHLVPLQSEGDLSFSKAKAAEPGDLARIAQAIRERLGRP